MKKNDKLIVIVGVVILVLASIGVYYYDYGEEKAGMATIEDFFHVSGVTMNTPESVEVSDRNPFNTLIATPLTVNCKNGEMETNPLYVVNYTNPSEAVLKLENYYLRDNCDLTCFRDFDYESVKDFSLNIAEKYWKEAEAALIVEDSEEGYSLAVNAVPMASYLSIPVIVTDEFDEDVENVLNELKVEKVIVCGENLDGFEENYQNLVYDNVDEIVADMIDLLMNKFGDIDYLALSNPVDAYPPKVLDSKEIFFGSESDWSFTIPKDYKYALVKIEASSENHISYTIGADLENIHPELQSVEITDGGDAIPLRDERGNIIEYNFYREGVVYGRGGVTYNIYGSTDNAAKITIEKIEDPVVPMMKKLSMMSPYLASSHQGIVFAKPDFAFTANDDLRTEDGRKIPGFYMPRYNQELTTLSNKHVYDNVYKPLNRVLADMADISLNEATYSKDLQFLQEYYENKDLSIALVGGATVLPQYIYQNHMEPFGDIDEDGTDDTAYGMGGGGTPSDVIYGNVDPVRYDWANKAQDLYSEFPQMENVVGRIVGWDVQDADALILRSIFYDDIIENLEEWKDNAGYLAGDGIDFRKPFIRLMLERTLRVFTIIKNIASLTPLAGLTSFMDPDGPWKHETGFTKINGLRTISELEDKGFDVDEAWYSEAMIEGWTDEEIDEYMSSNNIRKIYSLLLRENQIMSLVGEDVVNGGEIFENSNYIFITAHGGIGTFGTAGTELFTTGLSKPVNWFFERFVTPVSGGWIGPSNFPPIITFEKSYKPRTVTGLNLGPSFMWLESCTCGKIDGVHPEQSVSMALLHSGIGNLVASTTGSNIPGGYLPGSHNTIFGETMWDTPFSIWKARRNWEKKAEQDIYPEAHFGPKIYEDMCKYMEEEDCSTGEALRYAKNKYLPEDIDWELWWTPPLSTGGVDVYGPHETAKYTSYFEFTIYGDPAFNPYEPVNEGS